MSQPMFSWESKGDVLGKPNLRAHDLGRIGQRKISHMDHKLAAQKDEFESRIESESRFKRQVLI